jgi:hypothetical protein
MRLRNTLDEPQWVNVNGGLIRVDPGEVADLPDTCSDLLDRPGWAAAAATKKGT